MVGPEGSGKTSLLYRHKLGQFTSPVPTIAFNCETMGARAADDKSSLSKASGITIWDIAGKEKLRPLWNLFLRSAHCLMFVVDSSDQLAVEEARLELNRLMGKQIGRTSLPTVVVANKQDIPAAMSAQEVATAVGVVELMAASHLCHVTAVSALTGDGLPEAMDSIYEIVYKWRRLNNSTTG